MRQRASRFAAALAACAFAGIAGAASLDDGVKALRAHDIDGAIRQLQPLAELGDPDAAFWLGTIYDDDTDRRHRDDNRAYMLLSRAARAGNPLAADALYRMRTHGKVSFMFETYGLKQEQIDALAPLRTAAESGNADAISVDDLTRLAVATCESMGRHTPTGPVDTRIDNQPALAWLQRAAQAGQPQAEFLVGLGYLGRQPCYVADPLPRDFGLAQKWLRKAAAQDIVSAQVMLARIDMQPPAGLTPDVPASLAGLRAAAARDQPQAVNALADYTARGLGLPADRAEADRLRQRAADLGDPAAIWTVASSLAGQDASPGQLKRAAALMAQCAEAGDTHCQYDLSMMYIQGRGVAADNALFLKWIRTAAANDDPTAATHLGQTLLFDTGANKDVKAGIDYLRAGVAGGHPVAMWRLADEYRSGDHLKQNLAKAWALDTLAAQRGAKEARDTLDQMRPQLDPAVIGKGEQLARAWTPSRLLPGAWNWRSLGQRPSEASDQF